MPFQMSARLACICAVESSRQREQHDYKSEGEVEMGRERERKSKMGGQMLVFLRTPCSLFSAATSLPSTGLLPARGRSLGTPAKPVLANAI